MIKELTRCVLLLGMCTLLLVGCAIPPSQGSTPPALTTPLTLPPATTSPTSLPSSTDWTTYHRNNARTGLVENAPDPHQLTRAWNVQLDGAVYAEPLVVGGRVIVATEGDSLYALNRNTGQVPWRTNVGSPVPLSTLPCGNYHGTVVASRTDGSGPLLSYQVPTPREGGIWAASGPAVDDAGHIYVAVGNGETTQGDWDHSDSVLRLSPALRLEDGFAPTQWQQDNASDADLGSMGPILLPGGLIFANGKSGLGYLLHADALGGVGGQALVKPICRAFGGAAALGSQLFVPCTDGLRQLVVGPGANLSLGWRAPAQINGSPIVGGHTVYSLDPTGTLYALDTASGTVRAMLSVGATSRFATPTLSGNQVFVGTLAGVVAANIA